MLIEESIKVHDQGFYVMWTWGYPTKGIQTTIWRARDDMTGMISAMSAIYFVSC